MPEGLSPAGHPAWSGAACLWPARGTEARGRPPPRRRPGPARRRESTLPPRSDPLRKNVKIAGLRSVGVTVMVAPGLRCPWATGAGRARLPNSLWRRRPLGRLARVDQPPHGHDANEHAGEHDRRRPGGSQERHDHRGGHQPERQSERAEREEGSPRDPPGLLQHGSCLAGGSRLFKTLRGPGPRTWNPPRGPWHERELRKAEDTPPPYR